MPVRRRLMHKSPRPAFRPRIYPQHGPLLGRGYVIRFFLLTDSAWYVGAAPLPRLLQGFATLRLAIRLRATIDSSYPPFTHGQAPLSTAPRGSRHHHFHLRHVAGLDRKVAPELLTGVPGEHGIAAGCQDVRRQGADGLLDRLT